MHRNATFTNALNDVWCVFYFSVCCPGLLWVDPWNRHLNNDLFLFLQEGCTAGTLTPRTPILEATLKENCEENSHLPLFFQQVCWLRFRAPCGTYLCLLCISSPVAPAR